MRIFRDYHGMEFDALGEIDNGLVLYSRAEHMDLAEVWPGKRTDLASLERNAAAFRRQERRRFFAGLRTSLVRAVSRIGGIRHAF